MHGISEVEWMWNQIVMYINVVVVFFNSRLMALKRMGIVDNYEVSFGWKQAVIILISRIHSLLYNCVKFIWVAGLVLLAFYLSWVTKTEFLLIIAIQYQADKWWE